MTAADPVPRAFVDTNILVYSFANDDAVRAPVAQELLDRLMATSAFHTSTQVLQELFVTLFRKGQRTMGANEILLSLDRLAKFPVFQVDYAAIRAAAKLSAGHKLSFWDALIVVAAARSGASVLYTEDLQHGRTILGVRIVNPFRRS
ncbi:MAG TPA: PIN domain-containing protein [Bryobacteraceae bacterium]|nr:PIN domain-containing protein [Bryobacteraceae bacterium]